MLCRLCVKPTFRHIASFSRSPRCAARFLQSQVAQRMPMQHTHITTRLMSTTIGRLSTSVLSTLPDHHTGDIIAMRDQLLKNDLSKIIVLDDDPTGTQTVHGVNVLFDFSVEAIAEEMRSKDSRVFYLLTNTRAMPAPEGKYLRWNKTACAHANNSCSTSVPVNSSYREKHCSCLTINILHFPNREQKRQHSTRPLSGGNRSDIGWT